MSEWGKEIKIEEDTEISQLTEEVVTGYKGKKEGKGKRESYYSMKKEREKEDETGELEYSGILSDFGELRSIELDFWDE